MPGRFSLDFVAIPQPALVARGYFIAADKLNQLPEPLLRASEVVSREIEINFEAEGRPPWDALEAATSERKSQLGLDPRILRATGELFEAVTSPDAWDIGMEGSTQAAALLRDTTDHGTFHITGTSFMPARDWSFVPDDALDRIEEVFYEWLEEAFAGASN